MTGLRVGEAIRLDRDDVDLERGLLLVRNSKGGKSRELPLHASTVEALRKYSLRRDQLLPEPRIASFFISRSGTRLLSSNLGMFFNEVLRHAGLPPHKRGQGPRLGDMRHSFAVNTLTSWHVAGVEVEPRLPLLSSFLGHINPASTYWYLSAGEELLNAAARRLDQLGELG